MNHRLEIFCDGVFAIAITLLILHIKVPPLESIHSIEDVWHEVWLLWPSFFALALSFIIIFISWIGHHNILKYVDKTSPQFLMANGFFLFTLIILPFPTAFMAEYLDTPYAQPAIIIYAAAGLFHNVGWTVLHRSILRPKPLVKDQAVMLTIRKSLKSSLIGSILYLFLALLAFWLPYVSLVITVLTWIYWLVLSLSVKQEN